MDFSSVLEQINSEMARLQAAKTALEAAVEAGAAMPATLPEVGPSHKRRKMSKEGREKIRQAQKARWAALRAAKK